MQENQRGTHDLGSIRKIKAWVKPINFQPDVWFEFENLDITFFTVVSP